MASVTPGLPTMSQEDLDRQALLKVGGAASQGALKTLAAVGDVSTAPARALAALYGNGVYNTAIRLPNAFGAGLSQFPNSNLTNQVFPAFNNVSAAQAGASLPSQPGQAPLIPSAPTAPAATTPTAPQAQVTPVSPAAPKGDFPPLNSQVNAGVAGAPAAPVQQPVDPIAQGIQQQQTYGNALYDKAMAFVNAASDGATAGNRLHLISGLIGATGGQNNFASLQEQRATAAANNAGALERTKLETAQRAQAAELQASAVNRQGLVHQVGATPIDPKNPALGSLPVFAQFTAQGEAPLNVTPIGTQAGIQAQQQKAVVPKVGAKYNGPDGTVQLPNGGTFTVKDKTVVGVK